MNKDNLNKLIHDARGHLNYLSLAAAMLKRKPDNLHKTLSMMENEIENLTKIVNLIHDENNK